MNVRGVELGHGLSWLKGVMSAEDVNVLSGNEMDKLVNENIKNEESIPSNQVHNFEHRYPEVIEWLEKRPHDARWKWSIALLSTQIADVSRSAQKHALGRFFTQSPCHRILKLLLIRNALQKIQIKSKKIGTGITEILCAMPSPPSKSTKERIIIDACDRGYCYKILGVDNLVKIVPKPIMLWAHCIEARAGLETMLGASQPELALEVGKQMDGSTWMAEINELISDEDKKDINFEADMFEDYSI